MADMLFSASSLIGSEDTDGRPRRSSSLANHESQRSASRRPDDVGGCQVRQGTQPPCCLRCCQGPMDVASVSSRDGASELPLSLITRNSLLQCRFAQETSPLLAPYDIPDVGVTDPEHRPQGPVGHAIAGQLAYCDDVIDGQLRVPVELAAVRPPVAHLLLEGRPATVARFVVALVVDAVQRKVGRAFTHIGEEVLEAAPALANGDTSTAVAGPVGTR